MKYKVTKTYGHDLGMSCVFRQPSAKSHCSLLHGYSLAFELVFTTDKLTPEGWVIDFGSLGSVKDWLKQNFDHTLVLAATDPQREEIMRLHRKGIARVVIMPSVGCEAFARHVAEYTQKWLELVGSDATLESVTVREHSSNAATFICTPSI